MIGIRFRGIWQVLTLSYLLGPVLLGTLYRADIWLFFLLARNPWNKPTSYAVWLNALSGLELLLLIILPVLAIRWTIRALDRGAPGDGAPV
jgi:hypothetical protein